MVNDKMRVELKSISDLNLAVEAARWTHGGDIKNHSKENNLDLLKRLIKMGHMSIFEHVVVTYGIHYITRACLQELVRHRIASYSVQSTRFTLKKYINNIDEIDDKEVYNYAFCPNPVILKQTKQVLQNMKQILGANPSYPNDKLKYLLPENWFVKDLMMTINIRSLFNFLFLRTSKTAHFEIRQLAEYMLELLPGDIKELYILYKEQEYKKFK